MTQEDKQLLLKDLCARLPYEVKIRTNEDDESYTLLAIHPNKDIAVIGLQFDDVFATSKIKIEDIKPYLRPMSSMTDDEKEELKNKCVHTETEEDWKGVRCDVWGIQILDKYDTRRWDNPIWTSTINMDAIDWLNAHHFDYHELIDRGLAIEVTEENNPYKE